MATRHKLASPTKYNVFKLIFKISISWKYFGNLNVQKIIWETGNMKLTKKIKKQNIKGIKDFLPVNLILFIGLKPLLGWWYLASLLEYISSENSNKINMSSINEIWLAVFRSSYDNHEL